MPDDGAFKKEAVHSRCFVCKKGSDCNGATTATVFFTDMSKVMHHLVSTTMHDFGDCYDRLAHTVQVVALQANGIPKMAVQNMLICL